MNDRDHVIFEHFAGAQAGNGDVLLAVVGVDGGFVFDGGAEILHGIFAGFDHGSVFFEHAHIRNLDALVGGVVTLLQLSPLLHAGFALHANAGLGLFPSGAIGLKAVVGVHLLDDEGFLRIVGMLRFGLRRIRSFFRSRRGRGLVGLLRLIRGGRLLGWIRGVRWLLTRLLGACADGQQTRKEKSEAAITHMLGKEP